MLDWFNQWDSSIIRSERMQKLSTLALGLSLLALLLLVKIQSDQSLELLASSLSRQVFVRNYPTSAFDDQTIELVSPQPLPNILTAVATPSPQPLIIASVTEAEIKISSPAVDVLASPTPIPKISAEPTPTPLPTSHPIPTFAQQRQALLTPITQNAPAGSLSGDKIFDLTNAYRKSKGLSELQKDERSCELARSRAPEIMDEVRTGTMHKGLTDRNLPYWNNENIAYYNTEEETVRWWASDDIHRRQLEGNFKYSCAACYKNACAQELTNFSPK